MESNFNNKDFEQFLKQNADQYRMFPSENVWKGIDIALHKRRKWYGLGLGLLLLLTGAGVTWVMITTPPAKPLTVNPSTIQTQTPGVPIEPRQPVAPSGPLLLQAPEQGSSHTYNFSFIPAESEIPAEPITDLNLHAIAGNETIENPVLAFNNIKPGTPLVFSPDILRNLSVFSTQTAPAVEEPASTVAPEKEILAFNELAPYTIESVVNSFKRPSDPKKISIQFYMAPTVSYRFLSQNKAFLRSAAYAGSVPPSVAYKDVNKAVTHKPDFGLEAGISAKYPLLRNLYIKAGIQFNISRYDIRAYNNPGEIATIALDAGTGNNSISKETYYRNYNGNRTNWLQNLYYSASIPAGVEWRFPGKQNRYFALGATVQPTYVIRDRAYLLSTDYKNYLEVPDLIRHWNLNTGLEALVGYSTRQFHWQIGPQVRYQVRSSFENQYPLKENLFDFGIRVGVMLNK